MSEGEQFDFSGASGQTLVGRIHRPAVEPLAWAVFAHCFSCSKESRAARYVSTSLAEQGIATLRFDFTGLGESQGTFDDAFGRDVEDIVAAADALRVHHRAPSLLVGHSRGGTAALAAAKRVPEAVGGRDDRRSVPSVGARRRSRHRRHRVAEEGDTGVSLASGRGGQHR